MLVRATIDKINAAILVQLTRHVPNLLHEVVEGIQWPKQDDDINVGHVKAHAKHHSGDHGAIIKCLVLQALRLVVVQHVQVVEAGAKDLGHHYLGPRLSVVEDQDLGVS